MRAAALALLLLAPPATAKSPAPARKADTRELRAYIQRTWKTLTREPRSAAAEADVKVSTAAGAVLYLPRPYVVPGGRFNEMYGWDSYFILRGLLRDGRVSLAKDMTDDQLYEVAHYGKVLNANRTYYLTRSQPPFLSAMVLAVYARTGDKKWLKASVPALEKYYSYWTSGGHLAGDTGLSRYFDEGEGPAPEVLSGERDAQGRSHYDRVRAFFHDRGGDPRFYDAKSDSLTAFFYKSDRSMRESGFDPSDRFGPFGSEVLEIAPVCLNSLLYAMEEDLARIQSILGNPAEEKAWRVRARGRAGRINQLAWDEKDGLYYDYDFEKKERRPYVFATTFYPLWTGLASSTQAARVEANLPRLERPGGLMTSDRRTGQQWDAPFGWAPLQLIAVEGLRRYGYEADASRLSREFLSLVLQEFAAHRAIVEKYDVAARTSRLEAELKYGYASNEIGFGWTNAVFEELYARLSAADRRSLDARR